MPLAAPVTKATLPATDRLRVESLRTARDATGWESPVGGGPPSPPPTDLRYLPPGDAAKRPGDLVDTGQHPVVVTAHDRRPAVLAHPGEVRLERRPAVGAVALQGPTVALGSRARRALENPVLHPLAHLPIAADDLAALVVDVVVSASGEEPHGDGVVGLVAGGRDDRRRSDRQVVEHVAFSVVDVALDLGLVLGPDAVGHHLTAQLRLAFAPRLLDEEETPLDPGQEGGLIEVGIVLADGLEPLRDRILGRVGVRRRPRRHPAQPFVGQRRLEGLLAAPGRGDPDRQHHKDDDDQQGDAAGTEPPAKEDREEPAVPPAEPATTEAAATATGEAAEAVPSSGSGEDEPAHLGLAVHAGATGGAEVGAGRGGGPA